MDSSVLVGFCILGFFDALLLVVIYFYCRNSTRSKVVTGVSLEEIVEERQFISSLQKKASEEWKTIHAEMHGVLQKVQVLASEAEQEVKQGVSQIAQEYAQGAERVVQDLEKPFQDLEKTKLQIEQLTKKLLQEKQILHKLLVRAEKIVSFFNHNLSFDEIAEEIKYRKYMDIRALLAKGIAAARVAKETGASKEEVDLVVSMTQQAG